MKRLIALILRIAAALGLYGKGRLDANKNATIKNLKDKVEANEIEDELSGSTGSDDVNALERLRRGD